MTNRIATVLLLQLLFLPVLASGQSSPLLVLKKRIPMPNVRGRIDHFSIDAEGQRLFVTGNGDHKLAVVDLRRDRLVHVIPNLDTPQAPFYDASTNRLFVASEGDGTVKMFDGTTFQLLRTVKLSSADADDIRYGARNGDIVIGYGGAKFLRGKVIRGSGDGGLGILDSAGKKIGQIAMDAHPEAFEIEKTGTRVFVNVPGLQEVEVADMVKRKVLVRWPVKICAANFPMALDEVDHRLFIGCRTPPRLAVLNTENGTAVAWSAIVGHTDDIFYDTGARRIYVITDGFTEVWRQKDPDHYARIGRYSTPGTGPTGFLSPQLHELFKWTPSHGQQPDEILVYEAK
jgi:DNA-binding beta-propeller fold protein YncE